MDQIVHEPVLKEAVLKSLKIADDNLYIDCTLGEGGHSKAILENGAKCRVIGFDQDKVIASIAEERLKKYGDAFTAVVTNFSRITAALTEMGITGVDGILMDLGISSFHYEKSGRGFSFIRDEKLDMRLSEDRKKTAHDVVNVYSDVELRRILRMYGEEKLAGLIVRAIIRERKKKVIETSKELAEIIWNAVPAKMRGGRIHPATRTFQAIRIEVNEELEVLKEALTQMIGVLKTGGRLCVISFHSLEDRIVKRFIKEHIPQCRCPEFLPRCQCGRPGELKAITKKPLMANEEEIKANPRSRSAKMRVAERL